MLGQKTLIIAIIAFLIGTITGWTAQNWRSAAQIAADRETHQKQVKASLIAQNQALSKTAYSSALIADFIGEHDEKTAKTIADLRARNAELARLRDRRPGSADRNRCVPTPAATPVDRPSAPSATGVSAELYGISFSISNKQRSEVELTEVYALEASLLRAELEACNAQYERARDLINGVSP